MKAGLATILLLAVLMLGGCVYGPYGYVRGDGYYGDAFYGYGSSYPYYGYYDYYGYYPYYGHPSIGLGFYYGDRFHGHRGGRGYEGRGGGHWSHGGDARGSRGSHR
ncbi:MAG: hypothetical protein GXC76_11070 [Rhodanobacteraceae bacterium]|nr:hypothetical protein [Rhodanobacteraceae bacterium]